MGGEWFRGWRGGGEEEWRRVWKMQCLLHVPPCVSTSAQYCVDVSVLGVHTLDVVARWCAHLSCSHCTMWQTCTASHPSCAGEVCTYVPCLSSCSFKSPVLAFYDRIYNTLEHLQRRDTNELVRTQQPSLCCINWRHCMHALLLHCPLPVPCMLRWDNHVVPHCLHRAFVSPCSPAWISVLWTVVCAVCLADLCTVEPYTTASVCKSALHLCKQPLSWASNSTTYIALEQHSPLSYAAISLSYTYIYIHACICMHIYVCIPSLL